MTKTNSRQKKIAYALRIILAVLFLLSAVAKLYPSPYFALTTFEIKQLVPMGFSDLGAAYFSRILIGCELALGVLLLQQHYFRQLVLPVSFLLLFIFSAHLTYEIAVSGNSGNCGCFGSLLPMTPLQALIKNILAMGLIGYLFYRTDKSADKRNFLVLVSVTLSAVLLVFLAGPMRSAPSPVSAIPLEEMTAAPLEPASVTTSSAAESVSPPTREGKDSEAVQKIEIPAGPKQKKSGFRTLFADIDTGKKTLCFFAPGCDHCRETAKQLTQLAKQSKDFPDIRIVFMDEEAELIPDFFAFAGAKYPYQLVEVGQFWQTMGTDKDTPGVLYLWNGNIIKTWDGIAEKKFDEKAFRMVIEKE